MSSMVPVLQYCSTVSSCYWRYTCTGTRVRECTPSSSSIDTGTGTRVRIAIHVYGLDIMQYIKYPQGYWHRNIAIWHSTLHALKCRQTLVPVHSMLSQYRYIHTQWIHAIHGMRWNCSTNRGNTSSNKTCHVFKGDCSFKVSLSFYFAV